MSAIKDVTGEVWGNLKIIGLLPSKKMGNSYYKQVECICSCGKVRTADYRELKKGKIKSCGCLVKRSNVLPGDMFNHWTIVKEVDAYKDKNENSLRMFFCRCVCGKEKNLTLNSMSSGNSKSCGCMIEYRSGHKLVDETSIIPELNIDKANKRNLGQWKIIKELSKKRRQDLSIERILELQCSCGTIVKRSMSRINKSKRCVECSRYNRKNTIPNEEREFRNRVSSRFSGMIQRCHNEKNKNYKSYGGRGITVCDEWRFDFKNFYQWYLLNMPLNSDLYNLEIDRIDNDKGYSPDNCQLITKKENLLKTKYINLTLEDVAFIRSDKFTDNMYSNYTCSKEVINKIKQGKTFK